MKISVVGAAGYVGSCTAVELALGGLADELVLIDPFKQNLVIHLAMDAGTAAADMGVKMRAGDFADMQDSQIVIVTAGAAQGLIASRMEMLPKNLSIIKDIADKIKQFAPDSIVITATNPVDPLNYAMYRFTGFDRQKVIGYTSNDTTRFRMMLGESLGQSPADIEAYVMGEHGESQALMFSSIEINGEPVKLDDGLKQKIRARVPEILRGYEELQTGRTAGITSAAGLKTMVEAIVDNTNEIIASSAVLDGEYGQTGLSMGVPLVIGSGGIHEIVELELDPEEEPYLEATLKVLKGAVEKVEEFIASSGK